MSAKPTIAEIEKVLLELLTADFAKIKILEVRVLNRAEDEDGYTFDVQVVFEGKSKDLDARKVAGAVRHVRPKLAEMGEDAFPIFSFVTKGDAGNLASA